MTSLKIKYASEIMSAMSEKLQDKDFTDMFVKEASEKTEVVEEEIKKEATEEISEEENARKLIANFAVSQLVKLANAIDGQGFEELSDEIDALAQKIADLK